MLSESRLQAACYQWAFNTYPQLRGLIFSIPNGGTRNIREAQLLKATGLTPGIPDMLCLYNGINAFEFKREDGRLSPAQEKIISIWRNSGIKVHLIKSETDFKDIITYIVCNMPPDEDEQSHEKNLLQNDSNFFLKCELFCTKLIYLLYECTFFNYKETMV